MTDGIEAAPKYRTGALWGVVTVLLLAGVVSSAFFVYGVADLVATLRWWRDVPLMAASGFVAVWMLLLLVGMLYRVDRLRGVPHKEVRLFD